MNKILNQLNRFFENTPDWVRKNKLLVWLMFLAFTVASVMGLPRLDLDMSTDSFFVSDDPVKIAYDRFRDTFGSDENVYIVYEAKGGDIFSDEVLTAIHGIQEEIFALTSEETGSPLDHILDINTLMNVSYLEVKGDDLISRDFIDQPLPLSEEDRERLRKQALEHPDYPELYLSSDSRYGGIMIRTDFGATPEEEGNEDDFSDVDVLSEKEEPYKPIKRKTVDMMEYTAFVNALNEIIEKPKYTGVATFYPVGNPVMMGTMSMIMEQMNFILLATMLFMMGILWYLFRSFSSVIWPILIVILSMCQAVGLVGWSGSKMNMMIMVLFMLILIIGVADSVHILSGYLFFRRKKLDHPTALREVFKKSGLACLLTSVTTSIGMLSLVFVPLQSIQTFGSAAAIGVLLAFANSIFILPLMLEVWRPLNSKKEKEQLKKSQVRIHLTQKFLQKLTPLPINYSIPVILFFFLIGGIFAYGISLVKVDSNIVEIFKEDVPLHKSYKMVDRIMGGSQNMEIFLRFEEADALQDPQVLNAIEKMQEYLENHPSKLVVSTSSLVDVIKNSFKTLNEDREDMYKLPQTRPLLAQTLFLFDAANSEDREQLVPDDYSEGRIGIRLLNAGSSEYVTLIREVDAQVKKLFDPLKKDYPEMDVRITGVVALMMEVVNQLSWSQIKSFGLALSVITVLLFLIFGSIKAGLVAIIPNILPVTITFGIMGFLGIDLDTDTLIIAPIVIGISVDDTIHFLTHYRAGVLKWGKVETAIEETLSEVGQAISFTSLVLVIGLGTMIASSHQGLANFGILSAVAILSALVSDLLFLPALCKVVNVEFRRVPRLHPA